MDVEERFGCLDSEFCPWAVFEDLTGIPENRSMGDLELSRMFKKYCSARKKEPFSEGGINRGAFENFCAFNGVMPVKLKAVRYSMTVEDYGKWIEAMEEANLIPHSKLSGIGCFLVDRDDFELHAMSLTGLRKDTDGNVDPRALAQALQKFFGLSTGLLEADQGVPATGYDSLTGEPMGGYEVWLMTRKSSMLKPDAVSLATFKDNQGFLTGKVWGEDRVLEELEKA